MAEAVDVASEHPDVQRVRADVQRVRDELLGSVGERGADDDGDEELNGDGGVEGEGESRQRVLGLIPQARQVLNQYQDPTVVADALVGAVQGRLTSAVQGALSQYGQEAGHVESGDAQQEGQEGNDVIGQALSVVAADPRAQGVIAVATTASEFIGGFTGDRASVAEGGGSLEQSEGGDDGIDGVSEADTESLSGLELVSSPGEGGVETRPETDAHAAGRLFGNVVSALGWTQKNVVDPVSEVARDYVTNARRVLNGESQEMVRERYERYRQIDLAQAERARASSAVAKRKRADLVLREHQVKALGNGAGVGCLLEADSFASPVGVNYPSFDLVGDSGFGDRATNPSFEDFVASCRESGANRAREAAPLRTALSVSSSHGQVKTLVPAYFDDYSVRVELAPSAMEALERQKGLDLSTGGVGDLREVRQEDEDSDAVVYYGAPATTEATGQQIATQEQIAREKATVTGWRLIDTPANAVVSLTRGAVNVFGLGSWFGLPTDGTVVDNDEVRFEDLDEGSAVSEENSVGADTAVETALTVTSSPEGSMSDQSDEDVVPGGDDEFESVDLTEDGGSEEQGKSPFTSTDGFLGEDFILGAEGAAMYYDSSQREVGGDLAPQETQEKKSSWWSTLGSAASYANPWAYGRKKQARRMTTDVVVTDEEYEFRDPIDQNFSLGGIATGYRERSDQLA